MLPEYEARLKELFSAAYAKNTRRTYWAGWQAFVAFCREKQLLTLPAEPVTVAMFAAHLADEGSTFGTVQTYLSAVSYVHRQCELMTPTAHPKVKQAVEGLARTLGKKPKNRKDPATLSELGRMLAKVDRTTLWGVRDAALLLVGFGGAFRRETLAATLAEHVLVGERGLLIHIPKDKTDQYGEGRDVAIPKNEGDPTLCPLVAFVTWRQRAAAAGLRHTHAFFGPSHGDESTMRALAGWHIADVVKKYAAAAGLDVRKFSGHSLRAGFVTESLSGDVPETQIIKVTGHNTTAMLPTYYREKDPFAAAGGGKVWGKKPTKPGGGKE